MKYPNETRLHTLVYVITAFLLLSCGPESRIHSENIGQQDELVKLTLPIQDNDLPLPKFLGSLVSGKGCAAGLQYASIPFTQPGAAQFIENSPIESIAVEDPNKVFSESNTVLGVAKYRQVNGDTLEGKTLFELDNPCQVAESFSFLNIPVNRDGKFEFSTGSENVYLVFLITLSNEVFTMTPFKRVDIVKVPNPFFTDQAGSLGTKINKTTFDPSGNRYTIEYFPNNQSSSDGNLHAVAYNAFLNLLWIRDLESVVENSTSQAGLEYIEINDNGYVLVVARSSISLLDAKTGSIVDKKSVASLLNAGQSLETYAMAFDSENKLLYLGGSRSSDGVTYAPFVGTVQIIDKALVGIDYNKYDEPYLGIADMALESSRLYLVGVMNPQEGVVFVWKMETNQQGAIPNHSERKIDTGAQHVGSTSVALDKNHVYVLVRAHNKLTSSSDMLNFIYRLNSDDLSPTAGIWEQPYKSVGSLDDKNSTPPFNEHGNLIIKNGKLLYGRSAGVFNQNPRIRSVSIIDKTDKDIPLETDNIKQSNDVEIEHLTVNPKTAKLVVSGQASGPLQSGEGPVGFFEEKDL